MVGMQNKTPVNSGISSLWVLKTKVTASLSVLFRWVMQVPLS